MIGFENISSTCITLHDLSDSTNMMYIQSISHLQVCFERTDHIGGLWYYTSNAVDGQACVMKSTVINTSKEMMSYSDFPIPADYPNFMHNTKVVEYFTLYAHKFKLMDAIRFKTEILSVNKTLNFKETGQWELQVKVTPSLLLGFK